MAYRHGNRSQMTLLPQSIEEYIAHDDPVRAYDVFVEALDFNELGIEINPAKVGNSEYDPKAMLNFLSMVIHTALRAPANWNEPLIITCRLYGLWVA